VGRLGPLGDCGTGCKCNWIESERRRRIASASAARLRRWQRERMSSMTAVEPVQERSMARQPGWGRGEAGQPVACTAWREKVPSRDTAAPMSRERRGEEAHGRLLFMEADFIFSNYSQTVQHLILLLKVNLFTLMSSSTLLEGLTSNS